MKIGDKVSFLFDKGGGKVAAIKGNIVYVEDADGFQIPTPINRSCCGIFRRQLLNEQHGEGYAEHGTPPADTV